ncbi:MAG: hypothetical protein ACFB51_00840, partial [Anaerolineae bacterium]
AFFPALVPPLALLGGGSLSLAVCGYFGVPFPWPARLLGGGASAWQDVDPQGYVDSLWVDRP